ncbi:MAG: hypothetical protein ACLVML_05185 [Candidatus Gastranaerophilaceae bacterium]|nr:hypothetical protein [Christensenellales bacterium]
MRVEHVYDCSNHFEYGNIDANCICLSYEYDEGESCNFNKIIKMYEDIGSSTQWYLVISVIIESIIARLGGIAYYLKKIYNFSCQKIYQQEVIQNNPSLMGVVSFDFCELAKALNILGNLFSRTLIIRGKDMSIIEPNLLSESSQIVYSGDTSKWGNTISKLCLDDNHVITSIWGCDGKTFNIFRKA